MKTMTVNDFASEAAQAIDGVTKSREPLLLTRDGHPVAELVPCPSEFGRPVPGQLAHLLIAEGDIVSPLGESDWNACK